MNQGIRNPGVACSLWLRRRSRRDGCYLASLFVLNSLCLAPLHAVSEPIVIDYMLPAVSVAVAVQQRITTCPPSADDQMAAAIQHESTGDRSLLPLPFAVDYTIGVSAKAQPQRLVHLSVGSGFLVDRETQVHFNNDWYLKDFNGKTTGQGGPVLVSLIKAGVAAYGMVVPPVGVAAAAAEAAHAVAQSKARAKARGFRPGPGPELGWAVRSFIVCKPEISSALAAIKSKSADVDTLEQRIIAGDKTDLVQQMLTQRKAEIAKLESDLTQTSHGDGPLRPAMKTDGTIAGLQGRLGTLDLSKWLEVRDARRPVLKSFVDTGHGGWSLDGLLAAQPTVPGRFGYQVQIKVDDRFVSIVGCPSGQASAAVACRAAISTADPLKTRDLTYQRPVPATVDVYPFDHPCGVNVECPKAKDWAESEKASNSTAIKLPQLSRLYTLPTNGSIFVGHTVGAEFGDMGEPTMLKFNVGGGGTTASSVIDASVAAAQSAHDAQNAATKRELDALTNAHDLQVLLEQIQAESK